jgi:histone acetyltransferase (RNA polymerase elongator complex component)
MESILRNIIGRIHVSKPLDHVIDTCKAKLNKGTWNSMTQKEQEQFIACVKKIRKNDVDLYRYVMGGVR